MAEVEAMGPYRIVERVGADAHAVWYRGELAAGGGGGRDVVLTALLPHVRHNREICEAFAAAMNPQLVMRDPRVRWPLSARCSEGASFRVVPAEHGWSLDALLDRVPMSISACLWVTAWVASGLDRLRTADDAPFVHAGIDPRTIHVTTDGAVRLDTPLLRDRRGWSLSLRDEFAPPEARASRPDARSDVYALARTLRYALDRIFEASRATSEGPPQSVVRLEATLDRALAPDPRVRPQSAGSLARELGDILPIHIGAGHIVRHVSRLPVVTAALIGAPGLHEEPTTVLAEPPSASQAHGPRAAPAPTLRLVAGRGTGVLELGSAQTRWIVGRGRGADLVLDDPDASREHFEIIRVQGVLKAFDLGSKNGLTVNGLVADEHELRSGDELRAGQSLMRFEA